MATFTYEPLGPSTALLWLFVTCLITGLTYWLSGVQNALLAFPITQHALYVLFVYVFLTKSFYGLMRKEQSSLRHVMVGELLGPWLLAVVHGCGYMYILGTSCVNGFGPFPEVAGFGAGISIVGFALSLLLVFRSNLAFARWWEARGAVGIQCAMLRDVASGCTAGVSATSHPRLQQACARLFRYMHIWMPLMRLQVRKEIKEKLGELQLTPEEQQLLSQDCTPQMLLHSRLLHSLNEMQEAGMNRDLSMRLHKSFHKLLVGYHGADKIASTKIPSIYKRLLRLALVYYACVMVPLYVSWSYLYKLDSPEQCSDVLGSAITWFNFVGTLSIAVCTLFAINAIGIQLANPYGDHLYDLPLSNMTEGVRKDLVALEALTGPQARAPEVVVDFPAQDKDVNQAETGSTLCQGSPVSRPGSARQTWQQWQMQQQQQQNYAAWQWRAQQQQQMYQQQQFQKMRGKAGSKQVVPDPYMQQLPRAASMPPQPAMFVAAPEAPLPPIRNAPQPLHAEQAV